MTESFLRLLIWLGVMSLLTLILFGWDKLMAKLGHSRIPEAALLGGALLGGGTGALLGMLLFRHKIRKPPFPFLVPLFFLLQIGLLGWTFFR
jgi:uncharacterized membrane protein YsdA (DUF1294 family)